MAKTDKDKNKEIVPDAPATPEVSNAPATPEVKKEKMVKIKLPKIRGGADYEYLCINDRDWQIKRGVEVLVPECVAALLKDMERAEEKAYEFEDANKSE